jgi:hypothetical protein
MICGEPTLRLIRNGELELLVRATIIEKPDYAVASA